MSAPVQEANVGMDVAQGEDSTVMTVHLGGGLTQCITAEICDEWFLSLPVETRAEIYCAFFEISQEKTPEWIEARIDEALAAIRDPLNTIVDAAAEYARRQNAPLDDPYTVPSLPSHATRFLQRRPRCTGR